MPYLIYSIIFIFFGLGTFLTFIINRKLDKVKKVANWYKILVYFGIVVSIITIMYMNNYFFMFIAIIIVLRGLYELLYVEYKYKANSLFFIISISVYLFLSIFFIYFSFLSKEILIYTFLIVTVSDGFSQISGQLMGKTKLFKYISPSKTIEGFIGGIVFSIFISILIKGLLDFSLHKAIIFGLTVSILSEIGDLVASYYKRKHFTKDFPVIIPYHGGFLDRFDSFIFAGAFVGLYTLIFQL